MASVLDIIRHYQRDIEKHSDDEAKVLRCIDKLFQLKVTVQHLQDTGVGRTVNALRKEPGDVGQAARALVLKWKTMVAAEESDQEGDHRNDTTTHNGHGSGRESDDHSQHSRNSHDRHSSSKNTTPQSNQDRHRETNGHHSGTKRKYHSSEEEDQESKKKLKHTSSSEDDHKKPVVVKQEKLSDSESSDDDSESSDSDSESYTSESSQEVKVKTEVKQEIKKEKKESPDRHKSSSHSKHSHSHDDRKKESSSRESYKRHESSDRDSHRSSHHKSSKELSRQSSEASTKPSSHKHKSSHEKENSSDKRHKSDTSSDERKESKSSKHSSDKHKSSSHKHESSSERHKNSEKHSSKDHKSSSHKDKAPEKHKSSEKDTSKHKSKESSSTKESSGSSKDKHTSSSKEKSSSSKDKSSHSSEKKHSSSDRKSQSDKSKHRSEERSSEKKPKEKSSSSSSKSKSSSSSSKSKEEVPKKKSKLSNSEESGEDGIDCGSGASFAEALGMISPSKPKKKSFKDINSPSNSFSNDLSPAALLAPTARLAPLPALEISALPEISPNYKPRPPPKFLPHFSEEDAISAGISSKNQRTKVYSGNKVVGKITSLYEMCVHVLQEHIDALEYTGGVPYDILKPVIDRATPQQLFTLEHYNPYLMEDTDHLWQKFCEKSFRNKKRQELETWREMYMRCQEEQECRLRSLTANIKLTQEAKKAPIKQTKMAYVDSVVKPPRNIARKQALHGTAHAASASPASRVASLSTTPGVLKGGAPRPPSAAPVSSSSLNKPKKAPLMQKALQFMRGRKR